MIKTITQKELADILMDYLEKQNKKRPKEFRFKIEPIGGTIKGNEKTSVTLSVEVIY